MNIALHYMGGSNWLAGHTVLDLMLHALRRNSRVKTFLTVWSNQPEREYASLVNAADGIVVLPAEGLHLTRILKDNDINCFFSMPILSALQIHIPRVTWFYDFQHIYYPDNFTPEERDRRNRLFAQNASSTDVILTYSAAVRNDLLNFYPDCSDKLRVVRFVPHFPQAIVDDQPDASMPADLQSRKFFLLPNHFQPHKNHRIVIEALALLKDRNIKPTVVCTGGGGDPSLLRELTVLRDKLGLASQLLFLGHVNRAEYFQLLRKSVALLNPSLFEGYGMSTAEAKYIGRKAILSDLPVFHEHFHPDAVYFNPEKADELAETMAAIWNNTESGPDPAIEKASLETYNRDLIDFSCNLFQAFEGAVRMHGGNRRD